MPLPPTSVHPHTGHHGVFGERPYVNLPLLCCMVVAMDMPRPLPDPLVELIARRFRVIGEPMRIRLLDRLRDGSATVGELVEALDASQQNVSKHLGVLHQAGIVSRAKEGTSVRYAIADDTVFALCEQVCGGFREQLAELDGILSGGVA
jgi:DNA-binding transcriptional ArsR family regulator